MPGKPKPSPVPEPPPAAPTGVVWKGNDRLHPFLVPVAELREDPNNANRHPERSVASIAASYDRFGQQKPLISDRDLLVKDGNGQLRAALRLGWTHLAVLPSDLDGLELSRYALAVNRTAEHSEWDFQALASQLRAFRDQGAEIGDLGWESFELEPLLEASWTPPAPKPLPGPDAGGHRAVGGLVGPAPGMAVPVAVTTEQREVIGAAVARLRELEGDPEIPEGRCLELICADYLAANGHPGFD